MYIYSLEPIDQNDNTEEYQNLFNVNYPEKAQSVKDFLTEPRLSYFVCTRENGKLVGTMGISRWDSEHNGVDVQEGNYQFFHLVVDESHQYQGIAVGLIKMAVKFLIFIGARIIHNHKRENVIKHTIFTDLKFELIEYDETEVEYKWNYKLDIPNTDIADLIGEICNEYEEEQYEE